MSATVWVIGDKMSATMDAEKKTFGEWLREQMDLRDLSQADVARRADLSRQAISDYVNGNRTNPDSDALNGIARALKLPPEEVHRAAGKLPPKRDFASILDERLKHYLEQLPPERQEYWVEMIEMDVERQERKAKSNDAGEAHS